MPRLQRQDATGQSLREGDETAGPAVHPSSLPTIDRGSAAFQRTRRLDRHVHVTIWLIFLVYAGTELYGMCAIPIKVNESGVCTQEGPDPFMGNKREFFLASL